VLVKMNAESGKNSTPFYTLNAINASGFPQKIVMDKSGASYAGIENINKLLMLAGLISFIDIYQIKYLNSLVGQDHRAIKKSPNRRWESRLGIQRKQRLMALKLHIWPAKGNFLMMPACRPISSLWL
jgi:transposase-like protein